MSPPSVAPTDVAIIGMACRFPGAPDVEAFWQNLAAGVESIVELTEEELRAAGVDEALFRRPDYVRRGAVLDGLELFDAAFFGFSPREAATMDPQQRLFLECAWHSLEDAAHDPERFGGRIGVYASISASSYWRPDEGEPVVEQIQGMIGNDKDYLATRVSYCLNLRGPSFTVQTACSSAAVAVHLAYQGLLAHETDVAVAGGVSLRVPQRRGYLYQEQGIYSPDGRCRAFDASARGTLPGNGLGVVVLKRLSDALADGDRIRAVIKATAINNDGRAKVGFTAPSVEGQARVIAEALAVAGLTPMDLGFIEAHGTATPLGDPIELAALARVFSAAGPGVGRCAIGSVKTNIGHLDAAAGIAGLIKAALAVERGRVPASLHFETPNPELGLERTPFFVNTALCDWPNPRGPRRAGVNSFGLGGTNCHLVLEQAPARARPEARTGVLPLVLSARSPEALDAATRNLAEHLSRAPGESLADIAFTLQTGRRAFEHRRLLVASNTRDAAAALAALDPERLLTAAIPEQPPPVFFLFPGGGAHHPGMGRELYRRGGVFASEVDRCAGLVRPRLGRDLRELLLADADDERAAAGLRRPGLGLPALFTVEYALARQWFAWGVRPAAVMGHSLGEYVAACVADVLSLEDALALVVHRGALFDGLPEGAMISVGLTPEQAQELLGEELSLAAINAPDQCVLGGPRRAIDAAQARLEARGVPVRRLHIDVAAHSSMVEPLVEPFLRRLEGLRFSAPRIPLVSNVLGTWLSERDATDPAYWGRHLRQTVRWSDGLATLFEAPAAILLEVGPGRGLATVAARHKQRTDRHALVSSLGHPHDGDGDEARAVAALGRLWLAGIPVDWGAFYGPRRPARAALPPYPFQRERYWSEPRPRERAEGGNLFRIPSWKRAAPLPEGASTPRTWLLLAEEDGLGRQVQLQLEASGHRVFHARPRQEPESYRALLRSIPRDGDLGLHLLHLGAVQDGEEGATPWERFTAGQRRGFADVLQLLQALDEAGPGRRVALTLACSWLHQVSGTEEVQAGKATLVGLCATAEAELANLRTRIVDIGEPPPPGSTRALAAQLITEAASGGADRIIALRGPHRWVRTLEPLSPAEADSLGRRLRPGGVYLITGGLGGVGRLLAGRLAATPGVKLVLVGRSGGELALEGAEVMVAAADCTDTAQLAAVIAAAEKRFGPLCGVIHAAGTSGGGMIALKSPDAALDEMAPKVAGALVLDQLLGDRPLDFFIVLSSITAGIGAPGQAAYAAANAWLDAFAQQRSARGRTETFSLAWDRWHGVGMAAAVEALHARTSNAPLAGGLPSAEALDAFWAAPLRQGAPHVVISRRDFAAPPRLSTAAQPRPPRATSGPTAQAGTLEAVIAETWKAQLALDRLGLHDNFFERGGNSLYGAQIVAKLRELLGLELSLRSLFEHPTVSRLARYLEARRAPASAGDPELPRAPRESPCPATSAQQRLWFLQQLHPESRAYELRRAWRLQGPLGEAALRLALTDLVRRHEALRTTFTLEGHALKQVIRPPPDGVPLERGESDEAPFDLATGPLLRARLRALAPDRHVVELVLHHLIADGRALELIEEELWALYAAHLAGQPARLPEPRLQLADFAWQRSRLDEAALAPDLAYWKRQLAGVPAVDLPADRRRPPRPSFRGARAGLSLPPTLFTALRMLGQAHGCTPFITLLTAFKLLLARLSGQTDVAVGTPVSERTGEEFQDVVGDLTNLLVLRTDLSRRPGFSEALERVRDVVLEGFAHRRAPFEAVVDALGLERDPSVAPLFQVAFVLHGALPPPPRIPGLVVEREPAAAPAAKFDLLLELAELDGGLSGVLEYATDRFDAPTITRMLDIFRTLLTQGVAHPEQPFTSLRLWATPALASAPAPRPSLPCLHEGFEQSARRYPDAVAVTLGATSLSYRELNRRANRIAHALRQRGVGPDTLVALYLDRSPDLIAGMLGILKAGGAYVPIDPSVPAERVAFILNDTAAPVVLTTGDRLGALGAHPGAALCLDRDAAELAARPDSNPSPAASSQHLAYVIYTSGSTGRPKGVLVTHDNVARLFDTTRETFAFDARDVWTFFHSQAFDFSVWEIWGALLHGARLVIVPFEVSRSPGDFLALLRTAEVTVLNQTPSAFYPLIAAEAASADPRPLRLRLVVFGGESLEPRRLAPWFARHGDRTPRLVNMYGITETTVHVTVRELRGADADEASGSPIGAPLSDLSLYILDESGQPVPDEVVGEIYVGGAGVARGYLNRPELTGERFLDDPFSGTPGSRMYRSGDLARRRGGDLEYLGRTDQQVKIRGFRIEPGEIEAALAAHPGVRDVAVVAHTTGAGDARLYAYVVGDPVVELRAFLKERLPDYMIPAVFVSVPALPLTPNGKLDSAALSVPDSRPEQKTPLVAPETPGEALLTEIWAQVLELDRVGIDDNFFALGGDSLRSAQVRAELKARGWELTVVDLFRHQSIRELAPRLFRAESPEASGVPPPSLLGPEDRARLPGDVEDAYPLAALQAGMFFESELRPRSAAYHDLFTLKLRGPLEPAALRQALDALVQLHPVLRTAFDFTGYSEPLQLVRREARVEVRTLPPDSDFAAALEQERLRPFDPAIPPLLRVLVHADDTSRRQLALSFHHAILDGWSLSVLVKELFELYLPLCRGLGATVPAPPTTTYRDFIAAERAAVEDEAARRYWAGVLRQSPFTALPRWPVARPSSADRPIHSLAVDLSPGLGERLRTVAESVGAPLKSALLATHLVVLARWSAVPDVVTGLVVNGRPALPGVERVLGLFLNTVPFRLAPGRSTWRALLRRTFETEQELQPFRCRPLAVLQREHGGRPLFETAFNYTHFRQYEGLIQGDGPLTLEGSDFYEETSIPFATHFSLEPGTGALRLSLSHDGRALPEEEVAAIGRSYARALQALASTPDLPARDSFALLEPEGWRRAVEVWNRPEAEAPRADCAHHLFEAAAARAPGHPALVCGSTSLDFGELDRRANQLAHYLRRMGIGPEVRCGICLERSPELVMAVLAVLKAGGAYVPLDPAYPAERLAFMLADARAGILLTTRTLHDRLPRASDAHVLLLDPLAGPLQAEPAHAPQSLARPENAAYVLYTSGSTGKPKGVVVPHRGLSNLSDAQATAFGLGSGDRVLQFSSLSFDASIFEIMMALRAGATLVMATHEETLSGPRLAELLRERSVTCATLPPSVLALLPEEELPALSTLVVAGEACPAALVHRWGAGRRFFNAYGPTEATVWASLERCEDDGQPPSLGRPIDNVRLYVLDEGLQPVPVGVPGEIYLGGPGVARGYLNQPALTAERFVPDPFAVRPGGRLYRTGDRARCREDGRIDFLGRADDQVKLRGFRIEPGEIEAALRSHPGVRDAAVGVLGEDSAPQLVAWVTLREEPRPLVSELRAHLTEQLPRHLVPATFVTLDALPLTPSGKVDRRALPAPDRSRPELKDAFVAPRGSLELALAELWREVLPVDRVGVHDNFFDVGGDSLRMLRLHRMLRARFGAELSIIDMYEYPTIHFLARALGSKAGDSLLPTSVDERAALQREALLGLRREER